MINTTAPHQFGFRRFLSLINLAAVSAVMLAASGCHKDSFDLDESTRPTATPDDGPTTSDPTTNSLELTVETTFDRFDFDATRAGFVRADLGEDADAMRAGGNDDSGEPSRATLPITGFQYNSRDGNTRVLVEILDYAHLGIQINGNIDDADFVFAHLNENVVMPPTPSSTIAGAAADTMVRAIAFNGINPPTFPTATYALEGEMTYNGNRFYPDGALMADFANDRIGGEISLDGAEAADDFGGITFADGTTPITNSDNLTLGFGDVSDAANSGDILNDDLGFSGALNIITAEGFFSSLSGRPTGTYSGRFNDDTDSYVGGNEATAAPREVSGIFGGITDANNNELKGGFLGQCSADCRLPVIRVMSSTPTAQERDGRIVLMITSDLPAPATGLAVDINIGGALDGEFTANMEADCTNFPRCTVTILSGMQMVELTLTPLSDFSTEHLSTDPGERWTATLVDLGNYAVDPDPTNNNVAFTITDLIAAIGIMTSDTPIEGGAAVTLTITSSETVPAALTGGLSVTINIVGADNADFNNAVCTNLVCIVTIPAGSNSVSLILSPLSDFSTEPGEMWTATLVDDDDNDYNLDAGNNNVGFDITDLIAAVGIMTSDTPIEGGAAVTLTITSSETVPATLIGGLSVTIDITGADAADFNNAVCTNLVCIVTIPAGSNSVSLILSPLSDFSTETGERWTATLEDGDDYNPAAGGDDNVDFAITDLIAVVDIMTSDTTAIENGAVTLTITSDLAAPAGGLSVTIDISGNGLMTGEFTTNADCTGLQCVVIIPVGGMTVSLILSPLSDFSTEPGERWTATLVDTGAYNPAAGGDDNVAFDITDLIAAVGIMTSDTPIEGGAAVTLTITSDLAAPANGISVTVNIGGANANEFTANAEAVCTGLECVVIIPAGGMTVSLILSPLSDFSTEPGERWTATLVDTGAYDPAAGNENAGFAITDLIAAVGIITSDTARMEGGVAVTLTITSDLAAPAGGLNVTVDISGADGMDFTSADCTNPPRCVVRIPAGMRSVELIITPLTSDAVENIERWTAMIVPADTVFSVDSNADDVDFSITDPTFPTAMNGRTLNELEPLDDTPTVLDVDEIRDGGDANGSRAAIPITGLRYDDPNGPQIYVQRLTYAHLGIWTDGQEPTVITSPTATASDFDNDFRYAFLGDNAIAGSDFPNGGQANYEVEGDATYRGVNFFLEGNFVATFTGSGGGTFISNIGTDGVDPLDDFGSATAMVPDGMGGVRPVTAADRFRIFTNGGINNNGFSGTPIIDVAAGFFSDFLDDMGNQVITSASFSGRFYDDPTTYDRLVSDPDEVAGAGVIVNSIDGTGDLHFGFLGRCNTNCDTPNIIGLSSTDSRAQEGGQINLVIMSDTVAPMGGFLVMFEISGADLTEFTLPEADCVTNFPVCTVTILETTDSVDLVLSPTDDTTVETTENWMVTLMDGTNFIRDPANNAVAFDITDPVPLPAVSPDRTLADLNLYATPVVLASTAIRAGSESSTGTITGFRYNDPAGMPQIYVQRLQGFAHLGIWVGGEEPTVSGFDHNFLYASLADNAVAPTSPTPGAGIAVYFLEGDATYKGVNFFPDGSVRFNFGTVADGIGTPGMSYDGSITANGGTDENHFGADDARVPDGSTLGRFVNATDVLTINLVGSITADGFVGTRPDSGGTQISTTTIGTASGFFADLGNPPDITSASFSGRFYDSTGYSATSGNDPRELAGAGVIEDGGGTNNLHFGIIGSCGQACGPGTNNIP